MPDDANLIEESEMQLWDIIYKMHRANIRYEVIHQIMVEMVKTLELQGYVENWMETYNRPSQS